MTILTDNTAKADWSKLLIALFFAAIGFVSGFCVSLGILASNI